MAPFNAVRVCEITKAGMGNPILMAATDQTSDIVSAQKQGHHGHELESTTTDDPNTEDNILPENSSTAMSDLGNVHALTQSASFDDQNLNQINSIDPLMNLELGRLETPKQNAVLDNLSTPWNSEFYEQYFSGNSSIPDDDAARLLRDSLLVNAMLALAARFSSAPHLNQKPNVDKGEEFAQSAKDMYYCCLRAAQKNTLEFLQGCTLLAFQLYLHGPTTEGWMVIGTCTRLANELGLHAIDFESESDVFSPVSLEWSKKEGLRRVWWSVWELDTFSAAVACRPHTIDRMTMQVKLPVSDKNWFADMFVESSIINPDAVHSWHTLRDCPNQDERAWFLLINYLLLTAHDLGQQQNLQRKVIQEIEKAISCYTLILPPQFNLLEDLNPSSFRPNRVSNFNWIIVTNIMLQGCRVFVKLLHEDASTPRFWSSSRNLLTPLAAEPQFGAPEARCHIYTDQIIRIIRMWPPEFIPYASPFIGCLVLGPAALHLRVAMGHRQAAGDRSDAASLEEELLKLALSHIAMYWRFGALLLVQGMVKCLAWDFGSRGITVDCIATGGVKTDMYAEAAAKYLKGGDKMSIEEVDGKISEMSPLGRPGFPNDIAGVIAMLASPGAQWITGQTIHASGGAHMG
ncbi:hypothetical protein BFJ69_g7921 [Fusarium oxysporum]|uniref:Xylanolytic transcriptional activator regulatory domain-containing protein n=1 Tax=Fusarium oxysporum TaxID=5507 RepID=A0A420N4C2_FUSOX|nr:hypothetical protein BFJ69_g7921 [Fusarium oxysporum]